MKIRHGFVSNSSSSSFVVVALNSRGEEFLKAGRLWDLVSNTSAEDIIADYELDYEDCARPESVKRLRESELKGRTLAAITIDYNAEALYLAVDNAVNNGWIERLFGD